LVLVRFGRVKLLYISLIFKSILILNNLKFSTESMAIVFMQYCIFEVMYQ